MIIVMLNPSPSLPPSLPQRILDKFYDHHNSQIKEIEDAISDQKRLDANLEVRHDIFDVLRVSVVLSHDCHMTELDITPLVT